MAATTALIGVPHRYARLLAVVLMSSSAMLTLGVVRRLVAQVLGLILLGLSCVLCLSPFYRLGKRVLWRFIALAAVVMGTFVLSYPEMLGFFGLAFLIYHGLAATDVRRFVVPASKAVIAIAIMAGARVAPGAFSPFTVLFRQVQKRRAEQRLPAVVSYFFFSSALASTGG